MYDCNCKKCYGDAKEDVFDAYHERNYNYWFGDWFDADQADAQYRNAPPETPEERAFVDVQTRELIRRNRRTVMTHRGFRVSFPESIDVLSSLEYRRHTCPEDEVSETAEKLQQLVQQGIWSEEQEVHYKNLIDDFWYNKKYCNTPDQSAFPRHHALVAASLGSSIAILERTLWGAPIARMRILVGKFTDCADPSSFLTRVKAISIAHKPASSVFTETTARQRAKILAYSGIAGSIISRLFGGPARIRRQYAFKMTQRIHSSQACEILMDNRYHYDGAFSGTDATIVCTKCARAELRELYPRCIQDLKYKATQYRRGDIDICEMRSNPDFIRIYSLLIFCSKYLINIRRNKMEDPDKPQDASIKRPIRIMKFIAEFPGLYDFDVARAFGSVTMHFRNAAIGSQLRLANQGVYAALLSFAVVEPGMVDDYLAPEMNSKHGGSAENHIASRNKILGGDLLKKYRHHIPRTADALRDVCRN